MAQEFVDLFTAKSNLDKMPREIRAIAGYTVRTRSDLSRSIFFPLPASFVQLLFLFFSSIYFQISLSSSASLPVFCLFVLNSLVCVSLLSFYLRSCVYLSLPSASLSCRCSAKLICLYCLIQIEFARKYAPSQAFPLLGGFILLR